MDEITIATAVVSAFLGLGVGALVKFPKRIGGHEHEYNHLVDGKWACAHCEKIRPSNG